MARSPLFRVVRRLLSAAAQRNRRGSTGISRRQFLVGAAGLGALAATGRRGSVLAPSSSADAIAVVGGGVAGLTVAYRLAQKGIGCTVYEASPRWGGRMWSRPGFNEDGMYVDLGGELVDSGHADLIGLCAELGVPLGGFAEDEVGLAGEVFFADGKLRTVDEVVTGFRPLAALLNVDIQALSPGGVFTMPTYQNTLGPEVVALDRTTLREYLYSKSAEVEGWVLDIVNQAYVGEYGRETDEQSALNLLVLTSTDTTQGLQLFGSSDESMRILGGSQQLPLALARAIQGKVPLLGEHRLVAICDRGASFRLIFSTPGGTVERDAQRVVFTLPFSTLREVQGIEALGMTPVKLRSIQELGYGTSTKLMLGFHSRFWRQATGPVPASRGVIFMDSRTQEFWDTSRLQAGSRGILTAFRGGKSGAHILPTVTRETLRELGVLYPQVEGLYDGHHLLMKWDASPFQKGSYSCPLPGQYTAFNGAEAEPELGGRLLFAGEHCSLDFQGFMDGAVQTANAAAAMVIGGRITSRATRRAVLRSAFGQ